MLEKICTWGWKKDDFNRSGVIVEDFFEYGGQLFGLAADGEYHEFLSITPGQDVEAAFLSDRQSAKQELDSRALIGFEAGGLSRSDTIGLDTPSLLMPGLLGLGVAGAVLTVSNSKSEHSSSQVGGLDTSVPAGKASIDQVQDAVGSQVGDVEAGGVTDDKTPSFKGTGPPGATVVIIDNGKNIGQALVRADGAWVFVVTQPLAEGIHTIIVAEKGKNGSLGELSEAFGFIVDTVAPGKPTIDSVTGADNQLIPDNGFTKNDTPTLAGKGEVGALIEIYANGQKLGEAHVSSDGTWSFVPGQSISDGEYVFTAVATDVAGNIGLPSASITITIDTTTPTSLTIDPVIEQQGDAPPNVLSGGGCG
ncbi:Ig-like domain-containing protein [Pseudomonas chlororaphis]|uniref:Ig-like domain-containing protein n=1 Tax=Pseudomonas chlororaphis TaxID=587753 RepID=UPI000F570EA4|nr:Ig-like domain-containing protein [Pseudomonas chlororaphis]